MWQYIFNPFSKFSAKPMMMIGIIIAVIGAFISYFNKTIFDGILDAHTYMFITYSQAITANIINIIIPCTLLFILGKSINPKTQMIDILNTSFYYRIPIYFIVLLMNLPNIKSLEFKIQNHLNDLTKLNFTTTELLSLTLFASLSIGLLVYSVVIMLNGFRHASKPTKWQHYFGFVLVLIICEFLSKLIIGKIL
ncbi:hypothetical protein [Chryseobacterium sp. T1]